MVAIAKQLVFHFTAQPTLPAPFLRIAIERSWLLSACLQLPVDTVQAVVFDGTVTLVAPLLGGRATPDGRFSLHKAGSVPPTIVPMVGTVVLTMVRLSATVLWRLFIPCASLWILAAVVLTVSVEQQSDIQRAIACGLAGVLPSLETALTCIGSVSL